MKVTVGVMGSASGELDPEVCKRVFELGREIARQGCILITGGCPGYPYEATKGAKAEGGLTIGISPAMGLREHVERYHSPINSIDLLVYTGTGLMGREVTAVRSCDIVIIVGGRSGTLGEFAIAYDEGKLIGVLEGTGGIADRIHEITSIIRKDTGCEIVYDSDPKALIQRLLKVHETEKERARVRKYFYG